MLTCGRCEQENPEGFRFCGGCGAPLTADLPTKRTERKIVTVLFADLVGFTARAEQLDPEEVAALLHPYYERLRLELERFGGTVEKFIGDAVMALFGAPIAHGDDPMRAVRAALAIRDTMRQHGEALQVRIGVNTGEALVTLDARVSAGEGMAAGDVVNTAARLQSAAPVNGILVGEGTYRATASAIDYRQAEPITAKGKAGQIRVWEAMRARGRSELEESSRSRSPFVGRAHELEQLTSALSAVRAEGSPCLKTVVGPAGIGKSRLVLELLETMERLGEPHLTCLKGRSLPYGEGISFGALGEVVKAQAGVLESDSEERAEEKLTRTIADVVREESERAWLLKHLRPLVGLGGDGETVEPSEVFTAWRRFLEDLAVAGPLVLVFEDIHWADDGLLDFIEDLVAVATSSIAVICTARPEVLERRPTWADRRTTLALPPLHDKDVAQLLSTLLRPTDLSEGFERVLLDRVGGNPLYAEQYARMTVERGTGEIPELPESVHAIIAARLDLLPPGEKALLQDAAVIGREFWVGAVCQLGEVERRTAEDHLLELERRELVRKEPLSAVEGEMQFAFPHVLVRDVAYSQIPRTRRAEKHRYTAEWIQELASERTSDRAEMLGHHYLQALEFARAAGQDTDEFAPVAREALRDAGARAWWLGAHSSAARFYAAALELTPVDEPDRAESLFRYSRALYWSEDTGLESMAEAVDALAAQGQVEAAAEAASWTSKAVWMRGNRDEAYRYIELALALVESLPGSPAAAEVLTRRASYHMFAGEYHEAIRRSLEALPLVERLGLDGLRSRVLNVLGTSRVFVGDPSGVDDLEQSLTVADEANSAELLHAAYENLFSAHMQLGQLDQAAWTAAAMRQSVQRRGAAHIRLWVRVDMVREAFAVGRWVDALRSADEFLAEVEAGHPHYLEAPCRSIRAAIRLTRGDLVGAKEDADKAREAGSRAKDIQILAPALWAKAAVLVAEGRTDEAETYASELLAGSPPGIWNLLEWGCIIDFVWVVVDVHQEAKLVSLLAEAPPTPWTDAASAIVGGNLVRALEILGAMGNLGGEANTRLRLADALRSKGRQEEADTVAAAALEFYRSVREGIVVDSAEAPLAASR